MPLGAGPRQYGGGVDPSGKRIDVRSKRLELYIPGHGEVLVSISGGDVCVGCARISIPAWNELSNRVTQLLYSRSSSNEG